jgi:hypothetical protein
MVPSSKLMSSSSMPVNSDTRKPQSNRKSKMSVLRTLLPLEDRHKLNRLCTPHLIEGIDYPCLRLRDGYFHHQIGGDIFLTLRASEKGFQGTDITLYCSPG